jgi:diguanylate cyclase
MSRPAGPRLPQQDQSHESGRLMLAAQLRQSLQRCDALQTEILNTQAILAHLRQELDGTRAGERRAYHLAMHDGLTGLPNQRFFMARLAQVLAGWTPEPPTGADVTAPSVVFLDLDGFKQVNDTHGHLAGDALLQAMASRLGATVRNGDVVARMGGDEFACLLEGPLPGPQLKRLAQKLFVKMAAPLTLPLPQGGRVTLQVAPSIGLARCPQDGTTPETLLAAADAAMYQAKRSRSQVAFGSAPRA